MSAAADIATLPWPARACGPLTARRLTRLLAGYLAVAAVGVALLHAPVSDAWRVAGLGLILPGAGFLAHADVCTSASGLGHLSLALLALGGFALAMVAWFATGNVLAPPLAWLGSAVWAAAMVQGPLSPQLSDLAHAAAWLACLPPVLVWPGWLAWARWQRRRDNAYLTQMAPRASEVFTALHAAAAPPAEMGITHLQRLRFALDRALQPIERFDGFENLDPFQTAAMRYQLNFLAYGLAMTQARYTPAFRGYMHEAQLQLLHKQRQHCIWSYWALESLWGHLRRNPDPISHDNIMFTGFVALQMALFEASTGSREASRPGFFTLNHPSGQRFVHDHASLVAQLHTAFSQAPFGLVPCEPNWIYPLCNTLGASALLAYDVRHGHTRWQAQHATAFRKHLDAEFVDARGRLTPSRSSLTGLALPAIGGAMPQALPCFFLNALAPDVARRQWLLLRRQLLDAQGRLQPQAFWPIDTGNYGFSRASAYTATALAAAELGDDTVYRQCLAALDSECPSTLHAGVAHRDRASVWSHGVELMALAGGRDAFRDLICSPQPPLQPQGPWLDSAPYPDVLVAAAHCDAAGGLHLVLHGTGPQRLTLGGLQPGILYRVDGACVTHVVAGKQGRAKLPVALAGRTCVHLAPAAQVRP
jgi:Linalool dehydratase/isomerase